MHHTPKSFYDEADGAGVPLSAHGCQARDSFSSDAEGAPHLPQAADQVVICNRFVLAVEKFRRVVGES